MNLKNVWNLGIKELRGLKRDPIMLLLIVYAFSLSVWTSANSTPETMSNAAIAIVDEDQSHLSSRLISSFYPPWFVSPKLITSHEMDERMDTGIDTFALHIPPDFERDVLANKAPELQLSVDATRIGQAFTGAGYIQQIVSSEVNEFAAGYREQTKLPVDLTVRAKYNPSLDVSWFGAISSVIQSITMLTLVLTGAALIREKEHGTVEHLLVMPVSATEIMLSKIWSMGCVVLIGSAFSLTIVVQRLLEVPIQGSITLFFAGAVLMLFAMTALGIFMATIAGTMPQFALLMMMVLLPLQVLSGAMTALGIFMATIAGTMPQFALLMMMVLLPLQVLSGAMTPRESMPELIQTIMLAAPNTHFIMLSQGILFRGAGFDVVWPQLLSLFVIGCVLYTLALRRFRIFLR